ncbi:MAG: hypothetical protein JO076_07325, partial [Verrucomicrobia bacterium]|nr:hypothetical protein [Verrucomicrobiota bacterium]
MRIVLDLQAAQLDAQGTSEGCYSLAFAQAVIREAPQHDVWLVLNGRFPESFEPIYAAFSGLISRERIRVYELPGPLAAAASENTWRRQAAELLYENFVADLRPDIVHLCTVLDGWEDDTVATIRGLSESIPVATTLYEFPLTSLSRPSDPMFKRFYEQRLEFLRCADLIMTLSEAARQELINALDISASRIVNISEGPSSADYHQTAWSNIARDSVKAFEAVYRERQKKQGPVVTQTDRPALAFISPLPFERTGIADYSARLLPCLAKHYEIICVVDQPERIDPSICSQFPIRDMRWFEKNGVKFPRILYQLGNSPAHRHMLPLLEQFPGVIVLHDFFLGDLLWWMSESDYAPGVF